MKRRIPIWQIMVFILLLVSMACTMSLPALPGVQPSATPSPTPLPLPPTIVETVPAIGSVISQQPVLTLFFSEKMDRASVESALSGDFPGGFVFSWVDDSTLTLSPKIAFPADSQVTFSLATSAKSTSGLALPESINFSYQTPGKLSVAQTLPADAAADVSPDSAVVVTFNQPVVPLGAYSGSLPVGLTLEPAAPGKGEWLNTSTYIFHADPALAGGIQYTAHVNPKLVSQSGVALEPSSQNVAWSFTTTLPEVSGVKPVAGDAELNLDAVLEISFNQPMDQSSVEAGFSLSGPEGKVAGSLEWNKKFSVLTFKPAALLQRQAAYTLTVGAGSRSKGGVAIGKDWQVNYRSVSNFGVRSTSFPNGEVRPSNQNLQFTFNAPLAKYTNAELQDMLKVSPGSGNYGIYVNDAVVYVNGKFNPGQRYSITFPANLKDRWGQALGQDYVFSYSEPDADPSLNLGSYQQVMFTRPDDPRISVQALNLNTIFVSHGQMTLADFLNFQADYNFQNNYIPADQQSFTLNPNLPRNDNQPLAIDLSSGPLSPGFYFFNIDSPDLQYHNGNQRVLAVSNLNTTIKISPTEVLVWAVDLRTHLPAQNIQITLYDNKSKPIASGVTDVRGLWRGPVAEPAGYGNVYAILGQVGEDQFGVASSNWNMGVSSWDFGLSSDPSGPRPEAYLYTERPVYRPGDTVRYRGILKNGYDGRYTPTELTEVNGTWFGPYGTISPPQPVKLSAYGTFNGEFVLGANAEPGDYHFSISSGDKNIYGSDIYFKVADYRKPELNLSVTFSAEQVKSGQPLVGTLKAEYFFGAPAADLPITWRLYSSRSYFSIPQFNTGVQTSRWLISSETGKFGNTFLNGDGRTDADGNFSIPFNDIKVDDTSEVTLEISASESGGFPVSAHASVLLHPENFYVGVRPSAWVGQAGSALGFDLLSVDWDKKPVSQPLVVAFEKIRWDRSDGVYGEASFSPVYTPVDSKSVSTAADGSASVSFTPPDAGTYVLDVTSGSAHTQTLLWVSGGENAEWPNLPYQQIQLTANQDKYKAGETASVFIPNPFNTPIQALLTTERSTFKSVDVISIPAAGYTFNLPLSDDYAPNVYVSATLLGPQGVDFRQGYVNLAVDPAALILNVDLKATPEKAKPGDLITLELAVSDAKGQPVQAEFSMAVVDLAALALADPNSEDIVPAFYPIQPIGVNTGLTAAVYTRRLLDFGGGKGGGGGGDGPMTIRSKFPDTAYWKADIVTDAQGKASISFKLPDNLTTWQVDSRGLSSDTRVGQARVRVVTSKELIIRPQTPRFLVVGDHAELAAMLNNTTSQPLDAVVSLQATGLTLDDPALAEQKVNIPANGRVRVSWSGLVQNGENIDPVFSVKAGDLQDAARPDDGLIPVLRYSAPQTFSTAGVLTGKATRQEIIAMPRSFQPLGGNLQVELSPSLAAAILGTLKVMETDEKPWSSEQVISSLLSNIATYRALKDSGIDDPALTARLQTNLFSDLRQLMAFKNEDGGWRWNASSGKTDPYLTAYVLFGLQQVLESGLNLDKVLAGGQNLEEMNINQVILSGRTYLFANAEPFIGKTDLTVGWQANRAAFYFYILGQTGGFGDYTSLAEELYSQSDRLSPWARAMLALSLYQISPVDQRVTTLLSNLESGAIRSASGAHWESAAGDWMNPGSALFTTAVVVKALAERNPASPMVVDAVRYLASQRDQGGRWASSYETAWVLLALNKYMLASGELRGDFGFSADLNGTALAQGQAAGPQNMTLVSASAPLTQLNLGGANSLLINKQDGTGRLYYRAALTVDRPAESAPALEKGMSISRQYLDCSSKPCQPITAYQMKPDQSGRVTVRLTLTLPNDVYYLMLQDYIPAGSDILDSSLKTSQQGVEDQSVQVRFDPADPFGEGWGWWLFNRPQIYSSHIMWSADYLPAGTYELTYTIVPSLAGEYRVLPAHAWQTYFPEVQGTTAGALFEIKP